MNFDTDSDVGKKMLAELQRLKKENDTLNKNLSTSHMEMINNNLKHKVKILEDRFKKLRSRKNEIEIINKEITSENEFLLSFIPSNFILKKRKEKFTEEQNQEKEDILESGKEKDNENKNIEKEIKKDEVKTEIITEDRKSKANISKTIDKSEISKSHHDDGSHSESIKNDMEIDDNCMNKDEVSNVSDDDSNTW